MIYSDLILQSEQWNRLVEAHVRERLAHAYLFYGPAGSGKEGHAIELAALVNCTGSGRSESLLPDSDGLSQVARSGACGYCPSCQKVRVLQHPNIQLVVPLPRHVAITKDDPPLKALTPADLDDLTSQFAAKASDPYLPIQLKGAQSILINSIRELRRTAYLKPGEWGWRVVLILEAEKLCTGEAAAANALLKLLEEPPDRTIFILVTNRPHLLLDTIKSRCLGLYFPALAIDQVSGYIVKQHGLDDEQARILARVTGGNLIQTRQLADSDEKPLLKLEELVGNLLAAEPSHWQHQVTDLANLYRYHSLEFTYHLQLLQMWLRDLMVLKKAGDGEQITFTNCMTELRRYLNTWPQANWAAAAATIEPVLINLERNINPTLALTNMIINLREAISAGTVG